MASLCHTCMQPRSLTILLASYLNISGHLDGQNHSSQAARFHHSKQRFMGNNAEQTSSGRWCDSSCSSTLNDLNPSTLAPSTSRSPEPSTLIPLPSTKERIFRNLRTTNGTGNGQKKTELQTEKNIKDGKKKRKKELRIEKMEEKLNKKHKKKRKKTKKKKKKKKRNPPKSLPRKLRIKKRNLFRS